RMQRLLVGVRRSAEASQSRVARYGMIGLFAFVFLPFWMTGPVVGSVIGFLIGLKARHNLPIVLSATYAAVAIWAVFFERMNEWLAAYGRYAAFCLVLVVAVAALALRVVWTWKQNQGRGRTPGSSATGPPRTVED
ncbi:MAG: small multi-drug export protein, partial [Vicinamibacterales bacterium]|nr:small multi-drug export protein [Vicinamibacterales bacterium]